MKYHIQISKQGQFPKRFETDLALLKKDYAGKTVTITWELYKKTHSNQQLRYWYGAIVKSFAAKFGYDFNTSHEMLKYWCGWFDIKSDPDGNEVKIIRSITKNDRGEKSSTTDLMHLVDTAIRLCAEHGLQIESPEEFYSQNPTEYK